MDFSDFTSYPGPRVANTDFSPQQDSLSYTNDNFDKPYFADAYTTAPDHSLDTFFDYDSFLDQPISSVEGPAGPAGIVSNSQGVFNTSLPAAAPGPSNSNANSAFRETFNPGPFGQLEQFPSGFSFGPVRSASDSFESSCVSPQTHNTSRTPSLCGDGIQYHQSSSPELTPRSLKRESSSEAISNEEEPAPKRPQRKRGRPRLDRSNTDNQSSASPTANSQRTSRLPHNQVERKYREGLNSELERLRKAVPTLPQSEEGGAMGKPKPSKAMVLAGAIDYIKRIERERDMLREENEKLRRR